MNTALGDNLYLGVLLGLYIQVFLLGIIIILGSRGKVRIILLGCFCYLMAASTLYNIFWPTLNHSFVANFFLAGFKDTYFGPILFLYILLLSRPKNKKRLVFLHLLFPTLVSCIYLTLKFGIKEYYLQNFASLATFFLILKTLSFLFYLVYMWIERKRVDMVIPSLRKKYFVFFYLIMTYFFLTSVMSIISVYWVGWDEEFFQKINTFVYAPLGFLIYFLTVIFAISENNSLKNFFIPKSPYLSKNVIAKREEIDSALKERLIQEKLYKNPYIGPKEVAQLLAVRKEVLIEYLRMEYQQSFNEFLTHLRLEEFKRICDSGDFTNLSISGLAYEVGFKSRATFYRIFKQKVGVSPGVYLQQKMKA